MNYKKGEKQLLGYEYDFDKDGGAVGAISLRQFAGNVLTGNERIIGAYVLVDEDITSGGTPTITFGNATDSDGYMIDTFTLLDANKGAISGQVTGDLIWDDVQKVNIPYLPASAAEFNTQMAIGAAALTGGKIRFFLELLV